LIEILKNEGIEKDIIEVINNEVKNENYDYMNLEYLGAFRFFGPPNALPTFVLGGHF